jgi:hypothetical protein
MLSAAIVSLLLAWHADVGLAVLPEAWDVNEARETLTGLTAGVDRRVWKAVALRGEVMALRVLQAGDDAWLRGFSIGTRTRWGGPAVRRFVDVAVGLSDATQPVPPRGTRFNYLAAVGVGVEVPWGAAVVSVTGRWLHASNNGREGRHLNPDIQSLGAIVGVGWKH